MTFYWWSHWFWITFLINILFQTPFVQTYPLSETADYISNNTNTNNNKSINNDNKLLQSVNTRQTEIEVTETANASDNHVKIPLNERGDNDDTTDENTSDIDDLFSDRENKPNPIVLSSSSVKQLDFAKNSSNANTKYNNKNNTSNNNNTGNGGESKKNRTELISSSSGDHNKNLFIKYDREKGGRRGEGSEVFEEVPHKIGERRDVKNLTGVINDIVPSEKNGNGNADRSSISPFKNLDIATKNNNFNNNYSNFSSLSTNITTNKTALSSLGESSIPSSQRSTTVNTATITTIISTTTATKTKTTKYNSILMATPSPPSQPQIVVSNRSDELKSDWLNKNLKDTNNIKMMSSIEKESAGEERKVPFTLENANKQDELLRAESEHRSRKSKVLSAEYKHINRFINFSTDSKNLLTRSAASSQFNDHDEGNISSEALSVQRTYFLDAGTISGICFAIFGLCAAVATVGIVLYRRRYLNKPQTLSEPDSSVYIDDSTLRVSDNSDEMYSLDNDSFLNSLEAMTIQNYWTDTVKHTKL